MNGTEFGECWLLIERLQDREELGILDIMADSKAYRIASTNLYSRNFGDEVLVVDTVTGLYFSLRGCAVDVWSLIESGANPSDIIVAELGRRYDCGSGEALAATHSCLDDLLANDLIRETEARIEQTAIAPWTGAKQSLAAPLIERFTDMKDLLLLDPIHDVSERGWPRRASDPVSGS